MQLRELREYVTRRGWSPAAEYIDTISGAKASRPALDRLMTAAARREFDCVLVWKLDRFGRSVLHLSNGLAALTSYGVRFIAVTQAIDTDASNPTSRLMLAILAGVAEFERELLKERTLAGVRAAQAAGKTLGRPRRVFRRDEVTRLRSDGQSWRAIAQHLSVPVSTLRDACQCTESLSRKPPVSSAETKPQAARA
jgi:DNA invertase Pin-like site-specific DNA recombinase